VLEQIGALLIRHLGGFSRWAGDVSGPQQRAAKKWQQEQHAAVTGARNQETISAGAEVAPQHKVGAAAHEQPRFSVRVSQQTQLIGSDSSGIDDHASRPALLLTPWAFADGGAEATICAFKAHNTAIPHHLETRLCRRQQQQKVQTCIVELPIAVTNPAVEAAIQPREGALHPLGIQAAGGSKPS
tara:strand:- start:4438 stop:4992 length:555 start_codon:yes stop_codon:yes gene_type:complete